MLRTGCFAVLQSCSSSPVCSVQNVKGGWVGNASEVSWHALGMVATLLAGSECTLSSFVCTPHFPGLIHVGFLLLLRAEVAKTTSLVLRNCRVRGGKPLREAAQSRLLCAEGKPQTPAGPKKGFGSESGVFWHLHPECRG